MNNEVTDMAFYGTLNSVSIIFILFFLSYKLLMKTH